MGYAIGHFFALATGFDNEAKLKSESMFEKIRDQFQIILKNSFLDIETKEKAQEKLISLTPRMGSAT
jgi:predicted metalloendopeptidase